MRSPPRGCRSALSSYDRGVNRSRPLRVAEPVLSSADVRAVVRTLESGWISGYGDEVDHFEREFSDYCGAESGVATTNGSAALHLALAASGIGAGDEVVIPSFSMIAIHHAVASLGATVVLCDSEPATWNLNPVAVRAATTARTRAIVAMHTYGLPCDMDALHEIARECGAVLVEDAAEAHGALFRGRRAGSLGDVACFSFFANKVITCGEGGMLVTSDPEIAERARRLKDLGRIPGRHYAYAEVGYNYRLPSLQAALGRSQLANIEALLARRHRNAELYREGLAELAGLRFARRPEDRVGSDWMVGVLVEDEYGEKRDALRSRLEAEQIETRPFFTPVHAQPFFERATELAGAFPVAEDLASRGLLLPSGGDLSDGDVSRVVEALASS